MGLADRLISSCRHCRFYRLEGRRGGQCQQLGVPVRGNWKVCSLGSPPFLSPWQNLEEVWQQEIAPDSALPATKEIPLTIGSRE